jgi:hypothetical protein
VRKESTETKPQRFPARTAAPPANISAAVGTAANGPPFRGIVAGTKVVVGTMPAVNGGSATAEAPANAGACVGAARSGVADGLDGLRILEETSYQQPLHIEYPIPTK